MLSRLPLNQLAFLIAVLPTVTVHITWVVAASTSALEWCNPYWAKCHSISATGREVPQFYIFKALMLPTAALMLFYWWRLSRWVASQTLEQKSAKRIRFLGTTAALSLVIYTITLGAVGDLFALPRRIGVVGYFAFTAFAHLLLLHTLQDWVKNHSLAQPAYRSLFQLSMLLLILGVISAALGFAWKDYQHWDNAFEWWFAILMISQFVCVGLIYKKANPELNSKRSGF